MTDKKILSVFFSAMGLTLFAAILFLVMHEMDDHSIRIVLRTSAQTSFTFLILILCTRPLFQLNKKPYSIWLMKNRTLLGASFAGIHTGHMFLIMLRVYKVPNFNFVLSENILGTLVYLTIFAMLITSLKKPRLVIGVTAWKILHKLGLYFITLGFITIVAPSSFDKITEFNPWIAGLLMFAFGLRIAAYMKIIRNN